MSSITFDYNTNVLGTLARGIVSPFAAVAAFATGYIARRNAERRLASLDDRLLEDIGINRVDIHDIVWGHKGH